MAHSNWALCAAGWASRFRSRKSVAPCSGAGLWFCPFRDAALRRLRVDVLVRVGTSKKKQEVRTLMTVTVTGAARIQEFIIVSTPVASG
ncbi:hypothetical protein [Streptomyces sp. NPDC054887]